MKCQNCSTENKDNEVFCVICGVKLVVDFVEKSGDGAAANNVPSPLSVEGKPDVAKPQRTNEPGTGAPSGCMGEQYQVRTKFAFGTTSPGGLFQNKKRIAIIGGGALAAIVIAVVLIAMLGGGGDIENNIINNYEIYGTYYMLDEHDRVVLDRLFLFDSDMTAAIDGGSVRYDFEIDGDALTVYADGVDLEFLIVDEDTIFSDQYATFVRNWEDYDDWSGQGDLIDNWSDTDDGNKNVDAARSGYHEVQYENGERYDGDFVDGLRSGDGTYYYADGRVYQGEYADGKRNGYGWMDYADGSYYEGQWADDLISGQGTYYYYKSGKTYHGEFVRGKRNGYGRMDYADGSYYEGQWVDDIRSGQGAYYYKSGDIYHGEFVDGKINGYGRMDYADGSYYEGQWVDDKKAD